MSGNLRILKQMLKKGVNVNRCDLNGRTPLTLTAEHGHSEAMCVLIEAGADVNKDESCGKTPLIIASENGHSETICVLIEAGADVNGCESYCKTPLVMAAEHGHIKAMRVLIEAGADVNSCDYKTALIVAAEHGHSEVIRVLIEAGADVNRSRRMWGTPLKLAVRNNHVECVSLLIEAGADVNYGIPLHYAAENVMRLLLRSGAQISRDWRYMYGYPDKAGAELLVAAGAYQYSSLTKPDNLMEMCREVIREHLLKLDPHTHLFSRVTRLGLPATVADFLVYNQTIDDIEEDVKM